jgi:hypothetical protein
VQARDAAHSEPQKGATSTANTVTIATVAIRQLLPFPGTACLSFFRDFPTLRSSASGVNYTRWLVARPFPMNAVNGTQSIRSSPCTSKRNKELLAC